MSLRAITWAFDQHDTTPVQRLLLLAYADYANSDDEAWPGIDTLIEKTGYSKSTIYRERVRLCDAGKLEKLDKRDHYRIPTQGKTVPEGEKDSQTRKASIQGNLQEPPTTGTPAAEEDQPQKLYEAYIEIVRKGDYGRLPQAIPSGYRKDANAVLADWPMDTLLLALRGFVNFRRKKSGGDRFSDVFGTHIRQSRTERIEFWISNSDGGGASVLDGLPSEARVKITRAVVDVQRAFGSKDPDTLATGEEALAYLKDRGIEPEQRDGRLYFPALGGKS